MSNESRADNILCEFRNSLMMDLKQREVNSDIVGGGSVEIVKISDQMVKQVSTQ